LFVFGCLGGLCVCHAGTLPIEPYSQPFLLQLFFEYSLGFMTGQPEP
jgi:hypothetical protein